MRASTFERYIQRTEDIRQQREDLHNQIEKLQDSRYNLRKEMFDLEWDNHDVTDIQQRVGTLEAEIQSLEDERDVLFEELMDLHNVGPDGFFERPEDGFGGWLSKPLGPLPSCAKRVTPSTENLETVGNYRIMGFVLFLCAVTCLITLVLTVPWTGISPGLAILAGLEQILPWWLAMPCWLFTMYRLMKLLSRGIEMPWSKGKALDRAAMYEEQWFRMGAESWSARQRIYSCLSFGAVHLANIIYPAASLIVVGCVGGVFMWAYLREYKRSGSYERAVLASTKLHAAYNRFAFLYLGVAICLMVGLTVAQLVT